MSENSNSPSSYEYSGNAESARLDSFANRIVYKPNIDGKHPLQNLLEQIKLYNGDGKSQAEKFILSIAKNNDRTTLQVWGKPEHDGDHATHIVELDFEGADPEIRTNSHDLAIKSLEELSLELAPLKSELDTLRGLIGEKTLDAIWQDLNIKKQQSTENALPQPKEQKLLTVDHRFDTTPRLTAEPTRPLLTINKKVGRLEKFQASVVSALGSHGGELTYIDAYGKEVTTKVGSKDIIEQAAERYAHLKKSKTQEQREGNISKKTLNFLDSVWRGTMTSRIHEVKEKYHAVELMAAAGVETGITAEFDAEIDKRARKRIEEKRSAKKLGKFWGTLRDFGNEFVGREKDLHREKVAVVRELRSRYRANPAEDDNPLSALIHRDMRARQAFAENIENSPIDFLHQGDIKTFEAIPIAEDSDVAKFIKEHVLMRIKDDIIGKAETGKYDGKISAPLKAHLDEEIQNFFYSDAFEKWRSSLDPKQQEALQNSLTYASTILGNAETAFVPAIYDNLDFYKTAEALNIKIELNLGTGQFGPGGEIKAPSRFSKERTSANNALYQRIRERVN
ncbi:MAG: hypothetical protein UY18_C0032G0006, partial [Microgenomates group bacterium GW2011_GWF2_47_9]